MEAEQAWQVVLGQLQMDMSKAAFDTWVRNAELVEWKDNCFIIGVRNAYARDWLENRLTSTVTRLLSGLMETPQRVEFIVWHKEAPLKTSPDDLALAPSNGHNDPPQPRTVISRYRFENFVVGASNRLAHAASLAVAENPARAYNPLFIYGGVGLGKTHLLHAIGNTALERGLHVLYVSAEDFTNDLINAIRTHTTTAFRERYRNIDVLLIDDIQFIANKESTQEEFFHTFNTLYGQEKQLVISSDRPPKAMMTLEERLRSRFEWGLIVDIQPPDLETRVAILRSKAERAGREVPVEILYTIARQIQSNIRELEGALTRVLAYADLSGHPLSPALVEIALADLIPQRSQIDPGQVVNAVAQVFGISRERLLSRERSREVALPRQVAMYLLREEANVSFPQIGEVLGGRDHTTVLYACEKVADMIERDDYLRRRISQVRETLYGRSVAG
ncbi:chromosomal replication initiator protein DnaA [uncultured Thermanaerothrix sp.]|uniref:chromosomal replication initiator protein DnaA n=1 Tax=uncultured Thermanaerothrix sp. TaxID=1195149 RepID=UPI00260FBB40|nr:chromosomal replication initiator protein DnaA [uncultured Thermanaerothrix sp.]